MSERPHPSWSISLALCGSGGSGVMTAANMLVDAAARAGLFALFGRTSGPQIRGGEAAALLRLGDRPVCSVDDTFHILLGLDWHNVQRFAAELPLDAASIIITDPAQGEVPDILTRSGARIVALPMAELAKTVADGRANMVALGALCHLLGVAVEHVAQVVDKSLKHKRADAAQASMAAVRVGAQAARGLAIDRPLPAFPTVAADQPRWTITGNQAAGLGAIRAGITFCAAYPITPATEMLEWLSGALPQVGGTFVQAEDELASIAMCVGASFGGAPALTATSGPGLSLMVEGLGMAVASETPVVVVDVQRAGPSTGIPTKSEQADLNIALYGLHGDAPHLVLAPQSIADCLVTTQWAVQLAEALQTPAIVLSEQSLGQSRAIIPAPTASDSVASRRIASAPTDGSRFKRYALTADGISPMPVPGIPGCQYTADGLSHGETGLPSSQAADHVGQLDKRAAKLAGFDYGEAWATIAGDADATIAVLTWGACTGPAQEAVERARADGLRVRLVAPRLLSPARPAAMARALAGVRAVLVVELSHSGQFHHYVRAHYDLPPAQVLHRAGPLPIRPGEIHARLRAMTEQLAREEPS